jgi:hypothetical protein
MHERSSTIAVALSGSLALATLVVMGCVNGNELSRPVSSLSLDVITAESELGRNLMVIAESGSAFEDDVLESDTTAKK